MRYASSRYVSLLFAAVLSVGALAVAGCDSTGTDDGQTGSLQVMLTDAPFPFDRAEAANVTIERVLALTTSDTTETSVGEADDEGRVVLSDEEQSFNLLELRDGVTAPLAAEELPAGTYQQIRLILGEEASVVMDDGTTYDLTVPSGTQTGVKVLLGGLRIEPGAESELTLDFDVEDSFIVQGNPDTPAGIEGFLFKPTVKVKNIDE